MHYNIPVFIPHLACPFTCVFCNQKHISGRQKPMEVSGIVDQIELNLSTIDIESSTVEVAFFGGSFTCLDISEQKNYLEVVQPFIDKGKVKSIRLSTRPDYITDEILNLLKSMQVGTIELGLQSMDDDVLRSSGRGHIAEDVIKASGLIKSLGFRLGLQMMVGLPGDTADKSLQTAQSIIALQPDCVRIYPTIVVKNTKLEELFKKGEYHALSLEEAIEWVAPVLRLFIEAQVNIIRVGLHPSEEFESGGKLVAGPYHPSFRELAMTQIWYKEFKGITGEENKDITILVPFDEYNNAIGYKAYNRNYLKQIFRRVRFVRSDVLKGFTFHVDYC